jgi:prophage DNA circulation protein
MTGLPPILSGLLSAKKPTQLPPAWLTTLHNQPGSINGISFFVDAGSGKFGRRTVTHEYPGRDLPYVEDMGRKGRSLTLNAFVIGPDYMKARDALIAEVEKPGIKRIVHPWLGRMNMVVLDFDITETTKEGGAAMIVMVLAESAGEVLPIAVANTASTTLAVVKSAHLSVIGTMSAAVLNAATYVQTQMQDLVGFMDAGFQNMIGDLPIPAGVLTKVLSGAEAAIRGQNPLTAILGQWSTSAGILSSVVSLASGTNGMLGALVLGAYSSLLRSGALNSMGVSSNFFGGSPVAVRNMVMSPAPASVAPVAYSPRPVTPLKLVQSLAPNINWPTLPSNTPTQTEAANNLLAMKTAVAQVVAIEQARLSAVLAYDSQQDAFAVRDYVCEQLANLALTANYSVYVQLRQLQAAVYTDLTAQGNADPSVVTYTPLQTVPAIVIAYNLYGDASRESDILSRNPDILNPVFMSGGIPLEVLSA